MVSYLETACNPPVQRFLIQKLMVPTVPYFETACNPTSNGSLFRKRRFQWFPIQTLECNPHFQLFHIQKPFATIFGNVQEGNPPIQRFHVKKVVIPYLKTVSNCLKLFRNPPPFQRYLIQKPFASSRSNGSKFRNKWFQWFPIQKIDSNPQYQKNNI